MAKYRMRSRPDGFWYYLGEDASGMWERSEVSEVRNRITVATSLDAYVAAHQGWEVQRLTSCPRRVSV